MFLKKQIAGGLMVYTVIRVFSYFFSPSTPLYTANPVNWIISASILMAAIYFLLKKDIRGWYIIAAELTLGGAGSFLEIGGVALRTILLITAMSIFFFHITKEKNYKTIFEHTVLPPIFIGLFAIIITSALHGYTQGNSLTLIVADIIPYFFFLYYFPLSQLLPSEQFRQTIFSMILSAIIGNFIFIYITLIGFSNKLFVLQGSYYHWFRDVASGKITEYGFNFYRIVLNEHLLLIPLSIYIISCIIANKKNSTPTNFITISALLAILAVNLTRIYILALGVGLLFLFFKQNWKRWLLVSVAVITGFVLIFTGAHLIASRGKNIGWEFFGLRLQSITAPQTEESSLSRMLLLPKILEKIKNHPLLGNGLGDTVTVFSPVFKQNITTPHFDWGYLEIWAETGFIGLLAWCMLILHALKNTTRVYGYSAILLTLLIINLTSPGLFHVMGVLLIAVLLATKPTATPPSIQA